MMDSFLAWINEHIGWLISALICILKPRKCRKFAIMSNVTIMVFQSLHEAPGILYRIRVLHTRLPDYDSCDLLESN
jgi:hypothetical protein